MASERLRQWLAVFRRYWNPDWQDSSVVPAASVFGLIWVPLLAASVALAILVSPFNTPISNAMHDFGMKAVAKTVHYDDLVVIDIDDASLRELRPRLGGWPYSRDTFALLLRFMREVGAQQFVLNLVLSEPRDGDARLAQVLGERADVVLAAVAQKGDGERSPGSDPLRSQIAISGHYGQPAASWGGIVLPDDLLLAAQSRVAGLGSIGVISTRLDPDGMLRRLTLLHEANGLVYPSMAIAPKLQQLSASGAPLIYEDGAFMLGTWRWPVNAAGQVTVMLPGNADAVVRLAFSDVMEAALGLRDSTEVAAALAGRTVFVGSSAFLADEVMTPVGRVSGTSLLACVHGALQRGELIAPPKAWLAWTLAGISLSPSLLLWLRRRPALRSDLLASLAALVLIVGVAITAWADARVEVELLMPLVILLSGLFVAASLQLRWVGLVNRELSIKRAVAEAANQAKTEFLANVSHEIRTPMNALLGVADLLQRTPLNPEQQRYVSVFQRSGQTLFELINDLLDLSKIEAGRLDLEPRAFLLKRLLDDQHELLKARAAAKDLALVWTVTEDLPVAVVGDRRRLAQVLTNLVGNAIKFTEAGEVSVSITQGASGMCFEISDTGIGIRPDQQQRIFRPFIQADGSMTRAYGGTGLGLSIASGLVKQMGGHITLRSEPGVGSSFSFSIPLEASSAEEAREEPVAAASPAVFVDKATSNAALVAVADLPLPPFRILLTEDNEVNVLLVEAMLRDTGCEIEVATNGETALAKFYNGAYDLILMDVQMPGIDGHQTTREIRRIEAAEYRKPVVVIALTAHAFERDIQRSLDAGCNAHLTKPVSRDSLLGAINPFRAAVD